MTSLDAATAVMTRLREGGYEALLAGGCVRDHLLGIEPKDHDVATNARPEDVVRLFSRTKLVGAQFGVVLVTMGGREIEVATFRADGDYRDGRRPDGVTFTTAQADAQRRDFTINGMFYDPLADQVIDYVGGREDLAARVIRCIGDADRRFAEDHLRMLRAVRFAARLAFSIEPGTFDAIRRHAAQIKLISAERIRMELELILTAPRRSLGWHLMVSTGLAAHLVPGVSWSAAEAEVVERMLQSLDGMVTASLGFSVLFHGRPRAELLRIGRELRCSNEMIATVAGLVAAAPRLLTGSGVELADLKQLLHDQLFADAARLARAYATATDGDVSVVNALVARAARIRPEDVAPPPWVSGDDLAGWGVPPGPAYGRVLDAVYRAQRNESLASPEDAQAMARRLLSGDNSAK
jgi:poly(A) polymerase